MNENFLSFIWKFQLYQSNSLLFDGEKMEVIHPGELNCDSGPDFFNAKIKVGDTIWVGNVEVHLKASDWYRHGHDKGPAFDNVILHITGQNDQAVYTSKGRLVPTLELLFDKTYLVNYNELMVKQKWIPCAERIASIDPIIISSWFSKIGVERLESRTLHILDNLSNTVNDWDEAFYRQLARSYGFHVNSQPFEALANATPYKILKKYSDNLLRLEALLFGQAGLLCDDYSNDDYYVKLKTEYEFLHSKYHLQSVEPHVWKFMRLRPGNFPSIRIAQFAALIHQTPSLFSVILDAEHLSLLLEIFTYDVSEYWRTHYTFGNVSHPVRKSMGLESAKIIIINTIVPFYFIYGKKLGLTKYQDKAMQFLEQIEAEDNSLITQWRNLGIKPQNAFDTQALLQLKSEYCDKKRCLDCGIGAKIIITK
jgi:hypothetical protein